MKLALATLWALTSVGAHAALNSYLPLEEGGGTTTANTVAGAPGGDLQGGATWVVDPARGDVVGFDGVDGAIAAGTYGPVAPEDNVTWAFWSNTDPAQPDDNDVIVGNRSPDTGWMKFTTNAYEYRDLVEGAATFSVGLDYPSFTKGTWVHNAVVKSGRLFTYYRDGIAYLNAFGPETAGLPEGTPLYLGGDPAAGECWQGLIDDYASWSDVLPPETLLGLAAGKYAPPAAPLDVPGGLVSVFTDDFGTDLARWTITNRGLENNAEAGYDAPSLVDGAVLLGGTTANQYWYGSSLETVRTFDSRQRSEVKVDRVSLTGSGTAYRSSLWILGDDGHYLHLSQNFNEGGWSYNWRDDAGLASANTTGSGINLALLDGIDSDGENHKMSLRLIPGAVNGRLNIEMAVDGVVQAVQGFNNFPTSFRVILTGQGRATGDVVAATFDNVEVLQQPAQNLPPSFTGGLVVLASGRENAPFTASLAGFSSDPENQPLTFTKTGGSAWLSVAPNGAVTGTPGTEDVGVATLSISVSDGVGSAVGNIRIRVQPSTTPARVNLARWPLNDGSGAVAREILGGYPDANITNEGTGGLGADGASWVEDPERGMVLTFNGEDSNAAVPGTYAVVGSPPDTGTLPVFSTADDFSFSAWIKSEQAANNDIILGNRYDIANAEFTPRQFVKLTTSQFEWHWNGAGENIDIPDLTQGSWHHHTVVKEGASLFYYLDGVVKGMNTITGAPDQAMPIFFGGQGTENWRGRLSDIRFFSTPLSDADAAAVFAEAIPGALGTFNITGIQLDAQRNLKLTWETLPGVTYTVKASTDLTQWVQQAAGLTVGTLTIAPGGAPNTAVEKRIFYRVEAVPVIP